VYWPNLDWVGHEKYFVRLDGLWNFYLHPKMGHQIVNLWFTSSKKMWNFVFNYKKPNIRHSNSFLILQIVFELLLF
jgi:hypothetical protein